MAAYRPTVRALAAVAVLTAWGGSLTWLGLRRMESGSQADLSLLASRRLAPNEARFAVYAGDVQIGSAGITLDTLSPGYRIIETLTLETRADTGLVRSIRWTETVLLPDLSPDQISSRFVRAGQRHEGIASYEERDVTMRMANAGGTGVATIPGIDILHPLIALPFQIALRGDLNPGSTQSAMTLSGWPAAGKRMSWTIGADSMAIFPDSATFDTIRLRWQPAHYDTAKVYAIELDAPTGPYTVWIERTGTIAGIEYPFGTRWVRTDFNLAVSDFRRAIAGDPTAVRRGQAVLAPYAVGAARADTGTGKRAFRLARASSRMIRPTATVGLSGGRQFVSGDTIFVGDSAARGPARRAAEVAADPFIQRDAGPIMRLAASIERTAPDVVARLVELTRRSATLDTAYGAPTDALGTLRAGRGRPDGMARLFVALAQARQVSARYVVGFAVTDDVVLTHAWAEVWTADDGWVAVDPTLGRLRASSSLIRLGQAGSSHPDDLRTSLADVRLIPLTDTRTP